MTLPHLATSRSRHRYALAALSVAVAGCTLNGSQPADHSLTGITQPPTIWLFDETVTRVTFHRIGRCGDIPHPDVTEAWTPQEQLVVALDSAVRAAADVLLANHKSLRGEDYHIQYFGVIADGSRIVYINAVHRALATRMLRHPQSELGVEPVVICDAGLGAFQSSFDVESNRLDSIVFYSSYRGSTREGRAEHRPPPSER